MKIELDDIFSADGQDPVVEPTQEPVKEPETEPEKAPEEEEEEEDTEVSPTKAAAEFLVQAGLLSEDPGDVDADTLRDLIEQEQAAIIDETVEATFEDWQKSLPPDVFNLVKHTFNGGDPNEFIKGMTEYPLSIFDIESEQGQADFLRFYYTTVEKETKEDAQESIDALIDSSRLEKTAQKLYKKLAADRDKKLADLADQQVKARQAQEAQSRAQREKLATAVASVKEVAGYKIPKGEAVVLARFASQPVVEGGKQYASGLIAGIAKALENPEHLALLSKLVKGGFDTGFLTASTERKVVKKVQKKLNESPSPIDEDTIWD